ncbi:MAG: hypothetical protein QM764_09325 [Chitinophagaceae bacterium]
MKKAVLKRILLWSGSIFLLLIAILAIHIYIVTRPKAPDAHTIVMARIDFKQVINEDDAAKVTNWLYAQNGVDHATCNAKTKIAVFTFHPIKMTGDEIMKKFRTELNYNAIRYIPTADEMKNGCPVATTSAVYKIYNYFKNKL